MTLYEYDGKAGFNEILNFIWDPKGVEGENEELIFQRLGYLDHHVNLFTKADTYWLKVFRDNGTNDHEYLVAIYNDYCNQYIVCKNFVDYLEFLRSYLPALQNLNSLAGQRKKGV